MTLFICVNCRKIIGCSSTSSVLEHNCESCEQYEICKLGTPLNQPVGRHIFFVNYSNGCEGHNHKKIGFRRKEQQ